MLTVSAQLDAKNTQLEEEVKQLAEQADGVSTRIEDAVASMNEVWEPAAAHLQSSREPQHVQIAAAADKISDSVPSV